MATASWGTRATRRRLGPRGTLVGTVALGCVALVAWLCVRPGAPDGDVTPEATAEQARQARQTSAANDDVSAATASAPARRPEVEPSVPWRDGQRPVNPDEVRGLRGLVALQKRLFTRHVATREASAGQSAEPTMALILVRAHLARALATEEEIEAGRAWIVDENQPASSAGPSPRPDEVPVLMDLGDRRAIVHLSRTRHPRFWEADQERLRVERMEREADGRSHAASTWRPIGADLPAGQPKEQGR